MGAWTATLGVSSDASSLSAWAGPGGSMTDALPESCESLHRAPDLGAGDPGGVGRRDSEPDRRPGRDRDVAQRRDGAAGCAADRTRLLDLHRRAFGTCRNARRQPGGAARAPWSRGSTSGLYEHMAEVAARGAQSDGGGAGDAVRRRPPRRADRARPLHAGGRTPERRSAVAAVDLGRGRFPHS